MAKYVPKELPSFTIPLEDGLVFKIKPTANAWWRQSIRVCNLLAAFKAGLGTSHACDWARITSQQYKYFAKEHPQIEAVRKQYLKDLSMQAEETVAKGVKTNRRFALRYLMKTQPDKFPPPTLLKRIVELEVENAENVAYLREEIRSLKIIIGMYREASEFITHQQGKRFAKSAEKLVMDYNRKHRIGNNMIRRPKSPDDLESKPAVLPIQSKAPMPTKTPSPELTPEEIAREKFKYGIS